MERAEKSCEPIHPCYICAVRKGFYSEVMMMVVFDGFDKDEAHCAG